MRCQICLTCRWISSSFITMQVRLAASLCIDMILKALFHVQTAGSVSGTSVWRGYQCGEDLGGLIA